MTRSPLPRRVLACVLGVSVAVASTGCSSFQPKKQAVSIDTIPTGADLKIDGKPQGHAPLTLLLARNKDHVIVATNDNGSVVRNLHPKLSRNGVLDIVGTFLFLVPGIGLFSPGAYDLDTTQLVLQMPQENHTNGLQSTTPNTIITPVQK